jgi:hypothetical protein
MIRAFFYPPTRPFPPLKKTYRLSPPRVNLVVVDTPLSDDHRLDSRRIGRLASARRAAYRSRSFCLVAIGGSVVGAGQLAYQAIQNPAWRNRILYILGAVALLRLAWFFMRLAIGYHREASQSRETPPDHPPDFAPLSDGSQLATNLEKMMDTKMVDTPDEE